MDAPALGQALRRLYENPALADQLGAAARGAYLARYTPEKNFKRLKEIYEFAMGSERLPGNESSVCEEITQ